jgi:GNAT superfamily N-acetyltransferase
MSKVDVVEVESPSQLKQFITYPIRLYAGDKNYVAPLISERREFFDEQINPFYRTARTRRFLAVRNGEVVGRIATCVSYRHNEYHGEQTGFFGFFDTPNDYEIAHTLLKVAMIALKSAGMDRLRGPMNFSTNHECGFLVEGYDDPPMVMMSYNFPYQVELAERFGLKKAMDLLAFKISAENGIPQRIQSVVDKMRQRSKVTIRPLNMNQFERDLERIQQIYNSAWAKNWGFVPMDRAEFDYLAKNLRQVLDPNIVLIAECEGEPIGFTLALPNINQALIHLNGRLVPFGLLKLLWHTKIRNKVNSVRLITFGVVPRFRNRAVDSMLFIEVFRRGVERGYTWAELSWILESNELMCRAAEQMGAVVYKKYRIVEMPL